MTQTKRHGRVRSLALVGVLSVMLAGCTEGAGADASPTPSESNGAGVAAPSPEAEASPRSVRPSACLNGTWVADNEFFLATIQEFGDEVKGVTGRVTLDFSDDGSLVTSYQDWLIVAVVEGSEVTIRRDGTDTGTFSAGDTTVSLTETHIESTMVMSVAGTEMAIDPDPVVYTDASYTCEGSAASITTPDGMLRLSRP